MINISLNRLYKLQRPISFHWFCKLSIEKYSQFVWNNKNRNNQTRYPVANPGQLRTRSNSCIEILTVCDGNIKLKWKSSETNDDFQKMILRDFFNDPIQIYTSFHEKALSTFFSGKIKNEIEKSISEINICRRNQTSR